MDQARTTISKIFNGEPRSYTRFNLTQNMEGENSQVEMKLSSDMDEEVGGNGVGEHLNNHHPRVGNDPYVVRKPQRTPKNICFLIATTLLIFIIGYLIGYLVHRKKEMASPCTTFPPDLPVVPYDTGAVPLMDWSEVKTQLATKLSTGSFESTFREFASDSHQAGSPGDEALGKLVLKWFKEAGMTTWTDEHFVKLQDPPASGTNNVLFNGVSVGRLSGYLAYSPTGNVEGPVVHVRYGQVSELVQLMDKGITFDGKVVLVRVGKISLAEKVANAAKLNASAVLIYPDASYGENTQLYGHVHLGSGDPYTPGFPSFNHTQFPPVSSSGLPKIPAQTLTYSMAKTILGKLGGQQAPSEWKVTDKLGGESDIVTVEVNNVLVERQIHNVFGVIKGFVDADRYVVIGAQRDAWGPGFAKSTVGTSVLVELARAISSMVKDEFKPRRSIVFASWSAGEFGSIGATEWLEGYLASLNMKAFSYINLDAVVTGLGGFKASASPLMHPLLKSTIEEVSTYINPDKTIYSQFGGDNWENQILEPLKMDDPAYPFLTFSGIPSISFRFATDSNYPYFGTLQDTRAKLDFITSNQTPQLAKLAAQVAGQMALRLVHDHLLRLSPESYNIIIRQQVAEINRKFFNVQKQQPHILPNLTMKWLMSAAGTFSRSTRSLNIDIQNSNLDDLEMCRSINDRIMKVERDLLSPYVSPTDSPFRHILIGSGPQTLQALSAHLDSLKTSQPEADANLFRSQFALATWTIQGCANTLAGEIWSMDNQI